MIHDQYSVVGWDSRAREIVIGRRKNCDGEHKCATNLKIPAAQAPFGVQAFSLPTQCRTPKKVPREESNPKADLAAAPL